MFLGLIKTNSIIMLLILVVAKVGNLDLHNKGSIGWGIINKCVCKTILKYELATHGGSCSMNLLDLNTACGSCEHVGLRGSWWVL